MPIRPHDKKIEPSDDAEMWRFLKMGHFRDLLANEELYFRRTDLYKSDDPNEGLPTDNYLRKTKSERSCVAMTQWVDRLAIIVRRISRTESLKMT